ncbi:MAG TPA: phosphotransferase family protein [Candidatus Acidoferrum sp.]|nr:phosphotransferase family protein [Candidatus Acidoferrum sp.]
MTDLLDHPANIRPGEELDLAKLDPYLRAHFPNETGPLEVRQFPSGHSNLTYLLTIGASELVLRRPPFGSKVRSAHDMSREFRVLSKLHAVYPPAPEVLLYCDDDSILGAPFYVMQPIHGVILRKRLPPDLQLSPGKARRLNESLIDNLIRLHQVDYTRAGLADLGKPEGYLARQVRGWIERYHGSKTNDYPEVEKISQWLEQNMPVTQSAALIHNDYKFDNVVLDPHDITKITGVLDWEMCTIGDPLTDLGTTLAYWVNPSDPDELKENLSDVTTHEGSLTRAQVAQHYARETSSDISHIAFYLAFARFKLAVIVQQIFYRYHQGLTTDPRFATLPDRVSALFRASLTTAQTNQI